jgi:hypothetical protein
VENEKGRGRKVRNLKKFFVVTDRIISCDMIEKEQEGGRSQTDEEDQP